MKRLERLRPREKQRQQHTDAERQRIAAEDLGAGDQRVGPPAVVRHTEGAEGVDRRRHDVLRHVGQPHEQIPGQQQQQVRGYAQRVLAQPGFGSFHSGRSQASQRDRFADTKASSAKSACSRHTRSMASACPGDKLSFGSRQSIRASSPWRRNTSWQPGMQPAKSFATSKKALLQSVTRESSASKFASTRPPSIAAWMRFELLHGASRPHAPVPEQATPDAHVDLLVAALDGERREQIEHDVIVVAGVQRDALFGAGGHDAAHHIERAVAVEGCHLDRDDVVDQREAAPELHRQRNAADRRLQVKADQRNLLGDGGAMHDQLVDRSTLHRRQRQHAGVIAMLERQLRFGKRLRRAARQPGDHHQRALRPLARRARRQFQHRLVQPHFANRELRRMHPHRQATRTGVDVVARQRALTHGIELARSVQRQRVRRDDATPAQQRGDLLRQFRSMGAHRGKSVAAPMSATG